MLGLSTYTITKFVSVAVYIEPSRTQAKLISPTHTVAWSQVLERYRWYISPPISQVYTRVRSLNINSNEKRKTYLLTNMYQNTIHDLGHKINRSGLLSCQGGARLRATVVPTPVYMFFSFTATYRQSTSGSAVVALIVLSSLVDKENCLSYWFS